MRITKAVLLALLWSAVPLWAQGTYTAASCNQSDVNAVINGPTHKAVDGDTINVPAGTCTWASPLSVSVGISIVGAGAASTVILDKISSNHMFSVTVPSATSSTFRLSGMSLQPSGSTNGGMYAIASIGGTCNSNTCSHIRLDNLSISGWVNGTHFTGFMMSADNVFGVLDHLNVAFTTGGEFINIGHSSYMGVGSNGDNSWAQADSYGTDNALYIESSTFSDTDQVGMAITDSDLSGGARFVVRFNTLTNTSIQTHGTESTGRTRGVRQLEIYGNTLTCTSTGAGCDLIGQRGGTSLVFNNTIISSGGGQLNSEASLSVYRDGTSFNPWGFCDGQGQWDNNDGVVYASGTISSTSWSNGALVVKDASKSWTVNQWAVPGNTYSVVDTTITDSRGFHPGAEITSSASNSITSTNYAAWNVGTNLRLIMGIVTKFCGRRLALISLGMVAQALISQAQPHLQQAGSMSRWTRFTNGEVRLRVAILHGAGFILTGT